MSNLTLTCVKYAYSFYNKSRSLFVDLKELKTKNLQIA